MSISKGKVKKVKDLIRGALERGERVVLVRPISVIGNGRYASYSTDKTPKFLEVFKEYNISYSLGNDAPRGGQTGKFITFVIDGRNKLVKEVKADMVEEQNKMKREAEKKKERYKTIAKNLDVSNEEVEDFLTNYKESEHLYAIRKQNNLTFKELRAILKERVI